MVLSTLIDSLPGTPPHSLPSRITGDGGFAGYFPFHRLETLLRRGGSAGSLGTPAGRRVCSSSLPPTPWRPVLGDRASTLGGGPSTLGQPRPIPSRAPVQSVREEAEGRVRPSPIGWFRVTLLTTQCDCLPFLPPGKPCCLFSAYWWTECSSVLGSNEIGALESRELEAVVRLSPLR